MHQTVTKENLLWMEAGMDIREILEPAIHLMEVKERNVSFVPGVKTGSASYRHGKATESRNPKQGLD